MALHNAQSWFRRQAAPITLSIIASMIVFAFAWWFSATKGMEQFALASGWQSRPWSLLTYPWADTPFYSGLRILCFVFLTIWMLYTGGSVERDLGPVKYSILWLAMILLPAISIVLLGPLVGIVIAFGMWLPEAGITIVWCTRNPTAQIMLYGLIPLSGKILGWVTAAVTVLISGFGSPIYGFICALHLVVAWAFAANRIPFWTYSKGATFGGSRGRVDDRAPLNKKERMQPGYFDDVKRREKERDERERLRKLFESSISDDPKEDR